MSVHYTDLQFLVFILLLFHIPSIVYMSYFKIILHPNSSFSSYRPLWTLHPLQFLQLLQFLHYYRSYNYKYYSSHSSFHSSSNYRPYSLHCSYSHYGFHHISHINIHTYTILQSPLSCGFTTAPPLPFLQI